MGPPVLPMTRAGIEPGEASVQVSILRFGMVFALAWIVGCGSGSGPAGPALLGPAPRLSDLRSCPAAGDLDDDALLARLRGSRFAELEGYLEARQAGFERSVACEPDAWRAFMTFSRDDAWIGEATRAWVDASPDSFAAHTVHGIHHTAVARAQRGSSWTREIPPERRTAMRSAYEQALPALERGADLRRRNFVAHNRLIAVAMVLGADLDRERVFERSMKEVPHSFRVWAAEVLALSPRWGGSYVAMRWTAREAQQHVDANPKLRWLLGYEDAERAEAFAREERWADAVAAWERAFEHGDHTRWYPELVRAAWNAERLETAVAAAAAYRVRGGHAQEVLLTEGRALRKLGRHAESLAVMERLAARYPDDPWGPFEVGLSLLELDRHAEAEAHWLAALELSPDWYRALQSLCTLRMYALGRPGDAVPVGERMVELEPEEPTAWFWYGDALVRTGRQREGADAFRRYLLLVDPEAVFIAGGLERAREVLDQVDPPAATIDR